MNLKERVMRRRVLAEQCGELNDKTVFVNRVAKVVKGGRRFSFTALVVTGDGQGHVGYGLGKAGEVPDAIRKASDRARKSIVKIPLQGSTIPYDVLGKSSSSRVMLRPASPGTGVIAGSVVRAVIDSVGIKDILTKSIGSTNPANVLHATIEALVDLREPEGIARTRGVELAKVGYTPYKAA